MEAPHSFSHFRKRRILHADNMKRIIVVDDDPAILDSIDLILTRAGYIVTAYTNAYPLLNGQYELPDIFILDKQLPGLNGLDVCRFLKAQQSTGEIPVVMISASLNINLTAKEAGANNFLEKPFRMTELLTMVRKYV